MTGVIIATIVAGGLILAAASYPTFAESRDGWTITVRGDAGWWAVWFAYGGLTYLVGMFNIWGWLGLIAAVPLAFAVGFALTMILRQAVQYVSIVGPILANVWFWSH